MERCRTCDAWTPSDLEDANALQGAGICNAALEMWDVTDGADDPEHPWRSTRTVLPEHRKALFFVADSSGYYARLLTKPDFGCVEHRPRGDSSSTLEDGKD